MRQETQSPESVPLKQRVRLQKTPFFRKMYEFNEGESIGILKCNHNADYNFSTITSRISQEEKCLLFVRGTEYQQLSVEISGVFYGQFIV